MYQTFYFQAHALQTVLLAMEEKFELVTGLNFTEIDSSHFILEIDGLAMGNADLISRGLIDKIKQTIQHVIAIIEIWT